MRFREKGQARPPIRSMTVPFEHHIIKIDSRQIIEKVYGPPGGSRGEQSIEAFRKKNIKKRLRLRKKSIVMR